jgi:hypothetical protein
VTHLHISSPRDYENICLLSLIRHGSHLKRRAQKFLYCFLCIRSRLTFLPSRCLATIGIFLPRRLVLPRIYCLTHLPCFHLQFYSVLKSSLAISLVNIEFKTNHSEINSIIRADLVGLSSEIKRPGREANFHLVAR